MPPSEEVHYTQKIRYLEKIITIIGLCDYILPQVKSAAMHIHTQAQAHSLPPFPNIFFESVFVKSFITPLVLASTC